MSCRFFFDIETTGLNSHLCEIVEFYGVTDFGREIHFLNKPYVWSNEAQQIHKISPKMVETAKRIEYNFLMLLDFLESLPRPIHFWCYANPNTPQGYIHFDIGILKSTAYHLEVMGHKGVYWNRWMPIEMSSTNNSVHRLAKLAFKLSGYSQERVAKYLGIKYNPHKAKSDVNCMIKIHDMALRSLPIGMIDDTGKKLFKNPAIR